MTNPRVTIVVPVKSFNENLAECIDRCLELDYQDYELLILTDNPTKLNYPKTKVVPTGAVGPAEKRDLSLKYAEGEILAFLDDDAYPRSDWLRNAVRHFSNPQVAAVGGPAVTPPSDSLWQKASGAGFESKLGGGRFTYRYVPEQMQEVEDRKSVV